MFQQSAQQHAALFFVEAQLAFPHLKPACQVVVAGHLVGPPAPTP
jgi:hypothetical protein